MKYIMLVGDGMADRPLEELNNRTVLEAANTAYMDMIVRKGKIGMVHTIPQGMIPASDVANLSILGYAPKKYYHGRGPLEAANMGINLKENEVAFRCNTVTVSDKKMVDYSAGHIKTQESKILINYLNETIADDTMRFYHGISYRHLLIVKTESPEQARELCKLKCVAPHDILNKNISRYLPKGKHAEKIVEIMDKATAILADHDINRVRIDLNENPANMIWLWGQGPKPDMPLFKDLYGIKGSIISAVDLINGIGKIIGLKVVKVPGATGYYDTNYKGKAEYALNSLEKKDFVFVHVEAPDEAGHNGDIYAKIKAVEDFDRYVVGTIYEQMKDRNDFRIMVLPDHATPIAVRSHTGEAVPFAICGNSIEPDDACVFTESAGRAGNFIVDDGARIMDYLIKLEDIS